MCTLIVTIRTVLWYVMSLAGTLLILVASFTDRWLHFPRTAKNIIPGSANELMNTLTNLGNSINDGGIKTVEDLENNIVKGYLGLFKDCKRPEGAFFEGECVPSLDNLEEIYTDWNTAVYPHAWRGAILCFTLGLFVCILTHLFALLTICCRRCICCSVFTVCGSLQSFASILFTLGLIGYAAGWGSEMVSGKYCEESLPFVLGGGCEIGIAFWLALGGTICTVLASSLAIWAYQSTRSQKAEELQSQGDRCICLA